jgi:UDP-2-acetamido-2,6-beta-L-arabino-hexul-4-ose reductase
MTAPRQVDLTELQRNDDRGWSLSPLLASALAAGQLEDLHVVSVKPGTARGNHVHRDATEWLLIFGGPATLVWRSPTQPGQQERDLKGAGPWFFEIPPLVEHAISNRGEKTFYLVAFYDEPTPATESCTL